MRLVKRHSLSDKSIRSLCHNQISIWIAALLWGMAITSPLNAQWNGPVLCPLRSNTPYPVSAVGPGPLQVVTPPGGYRVQNVVTVQRPGPACQLSLEVTEKFANQFISRRDWQCGPVNDFILGAVVRGEQSTHTVTHLDFRPHAHRARMVLRLEGEIFNRTAGFTPQAVVYSLGHHRMRLEKEIEFDGRMLRTRTPSAFILPQQQNVAAWTPYSNIPVLGPFSNGVALRAADARKLQAEAIAAQRITDQAAPLFNRTVDMQLAKLNEKLRQQFRPFLERYRLLPDRQLLTSTEESLHWAIQFGKDCSFPPMKGTNLLSLRGEAATIRVHESLFNDLLARQPIGGLRVPDTVIDRFFQRMEQAAQASSESDITSQPKPRLATIVFDQVDPIRFRFSSSRTELILRLGIEPVTGPSIPTQELTIPFHIHQTEQRLIFRPGEVEIRAVNPDVPSAPLDEVARQLIRRQVQDRLAERSLPRRFTLPLADGSSIPMTIRQVAIQQGWLCVVID